MASWPTRLPSASALSLAAAPGVARADVAPELRLTFLDAGTVVPPALAAPAPTETWAGALACALLVAGAVLQRRRGRAGRRAPAEASDAALERLRRDLAAADAARAAAEDVARHKGEFLASMSHEIRTPLAAVIGFADLMLASPDLTAADRCSAERVKAGGDALLALVNDVLDWSQLEAGSLRLDARPFALPLLLDECIALVERAALAKRLALRVELADRFTAGVLGDDARLRQILLNLLNNAIKFTDAGSVTVRLRRDLEAGPHRLVIEVADTGVGIRAADLPGVFQRFRRADGAARRSGAGLGLAISKALAERMGGTIAVDSVDGVGSTFRLALDLPAAPVVIEAERAGTTGATRALRILLVEDIRINEELARAILEARGHEVDAVGDGADAIMAVEHGRYDLVLMDVQMPHVDGLAATRAIRRLPIAGRFAPIVAMTANVLREQLAAARASGMDDVLAKPFSLDALDELLGRAARGAIRRVAEPAPAVLAAIATRLGPVGLDQAFEGFARELAVRFAGSALPLLRAEATDTAAVAASLGFTSLARACEAFAAAPSLGDLDGLLREAGQVVAFVDARGVSGASVVLAA